MPARVVLGVGKCVLFSEVSSVQRLQEWYILGVGKCVLFREVFISSSSVQECPHRERGSTLLHIVPSLS